MAFPLFAPRRAPNGAPLPPNTRAPTVLGPGAAVYARGREVAALLLWTLAAFLTLALASHVEPAGSTETGVAGNWVGPVGTAAAHGLVGLIGLISWVVPLEAALLGIPFVRGRPSLISPARIAGDLLIALLAASLVQVGWPDQVAFGQARAGGAIGELFGELARSLFSTVGSFLVGFALLGLILIGRASFSFIALLQVIARSARRLVRGLRSLAEAWQTARKIELERAEASRRARLPRIAPMTGAEATVPVVAHDETELGEALLAADESPALSAEPTRKRRSRRREGAADEKADEEQGQPCDPARGVSERQVEGAAPDASEKGKRRTSRAKPARDLEQLDLELSEAEAGEAEPDALPEALLDAVAIPVSIEPPPRSKRSRKLEPKIVDTSAALEKERIGRAEREREKQKEMATGFRLPTVDLLVPAHVDPSVSLDRDVLFKNAELLVKTLADYGVVGKVEDILPGPTVTTFEVSPAAGTKVSKVASLADDLALALAKKVRIVAPIPGKNRIGFELPNERRVPVNLRDLVEDRRFQSLPVPLPVVLGRDILGNPVYADLASMPHVIVAGATGAGKSVGLNVMLTSLLYRRTPDELRLLMIDPKVVELAPFDRIPHMLLPVVTDMKQAATALKWAVDEMERRYQLFADAGTKNLGTYNAWVERVQRGEAKNPLPRTVLARDHNGIAEEVRPTDPDEGEQPLPEKLPLIVIVVDEFADLMMQQGKEVEAAVARLAQKARAAGMHVILATQRPSVDVITGMIKANFPTRIAYRVAQKVDSRTILDEQGAEHLLGRGDMLIKLNGTNDTKRVQCPMITEEEVQAVTDLLRSQGEPVYDENILKPRDDEGGPADEDEGEQDPMYDDAVRVVADTRRCSTSWLQRKLGLGYNRAARIVETMERRGLVGPANGSKDREVLIDSL